MRPVETKLNGPLEQRLVSQNYSAEKWAQHLHVDWHGVLVYGYMIAFHVTPRQGLNQAVVLRTRGDSGRRAVCAVA